MPDSQAIDPVETLNGHSAGDHLPCALHTLFQNNDPTLRDDLWSTVADSWFDGGKTDPKVCILGLDPASAEVWLTPTSGLSFAFNVMRAQVTGQKPDMGSHGTVSAIDLQRQRQPS